MSHEVLSVVMSYRSRSIQTLCELDEACARIEQNTQHAHSLHLTGIPLVNFRKKAQEIRITFQELSIFVPLNDGVKD